MISRGLRAAMRSDDSRWSRALRSLPIAILLVCSRSSRGNAQLRSTVAVHIPVFAGEYRIAHEAVTVPNGDSWKASGFWTWTGLGALLGVVVADGWVAMEIARNHSDDGMISPVIPLVYFGAAGGAAGGLLGAIGYTASHPGAEPPPR